MFDKAYVRRIDANTDIDAGLLAESLLFYQEVQLVLQVGSVLKLVQLMGIDNLIYLIEEGYIKPTLLIDSFGASTTTQNGLSSHKLVMFRQTGHLDDPGKRWNEEKTLLEVFSRAGYERSEATKISKTISKKIPLERISISGKKVDLCEMAMQDIADQEYVNLVTKLFFEANFPGFRIPQTWNVNATVHGDEIFLISNYDIAALNQWPLRAVPNIGHLTLSHVLAEILEARTDMFFAAKYGGDLVTTPVRTYTVKSKLDLLAIRSKLNREQIDLFHDELLQGASLKDAINNGQRSFSEFIGLLDKNRRFKEWLKGVEPDARLIKEYVQAVTRSSWLDKLPSKVFRFAMFNTVGPAFDIFTGIPGVGTATGLVASVADSFLLDKLIRGWKPNNFVDGDYQNFLRAE